MSAASNFQCIYFNNYRNKVFLRNLTEQLNTVIMPNTYTGVVKVNATELDLDLTLLGGQSFRWERIDKPNGAGTTEWHGIAYDAYWVLCQKPKKVIYTVTPAQNFTKAPALSPSKYFGNLLERYFRLDFDLSSRLEEWKKAHPHFNAIAPHLRAVRVLNQEPFENIVSFMCSQNNNIKRISTMINWLSEKYGELIGHLNGRNVYTFPTLSAMSEGNHDLEAILRQAKFGYRAKFIANTINKLNDFGGMEWLTQLRKLSYKEARLALSSLPGIGLKVADCICLMSLDHLEAVPIDTHIYKIAQRDYMSKELVGVKSVTPKVYDDIAQHFRAVYGIYAGWAQAVLFCSGLQQFQVETHKIDDTKKMKKIPSTTISSSVAIKKRKKT